MPLVRTFHVSHAADGGVVALFGLAGLPIDLASEASARQMYGGRPAPIPEKSAQELTRLLQEQTADVSLADQYEHALKDTLSKIGWLKLRTVERDTPGLPQGDQLDAQGHSLLRVATTQRISGDGRLLLVDSVLGFCPAGESGEPSARVQLRYRSEEIGAEGPTAAVALWAKNHGQAYRKSIAESVTENMKMTTMALEHMAGTHYSGRAEVLKIHMESESADAEGEQPALQMTGTIIEESRHRLILQAEWRGVSWFFSLPKNAIEARFHHGVTPGTPWRNFQH
jgi:hypothetical protein